MTDASMKPSSSKMKSKNSSKKRPRNSTYQEIFDSFLVECGKRNFKKAESILDEIISTKDIDKVSKQVAFVLSIQTENEFQDKSKHITKQIYDIIRDFATKNNNAISQYIMGRICDYGIESIDIQIDYKKAMHWYKLAAKQGYVRAQNNIGCMYRYGKGVEVDYKKVMYWYKLAAKQGYALAQNSIGWLYQHGNGVDVEGVHIDLVQ